MMKSKYQYPNSSRYYLILKFTIGNSNTRGFGLHTILSRFSFLGMKARKTHFVYIKNEIAMKLQDFGS